MEDVVFRIIMCCVSWNVQLDLACVRVCVLANGDGVTIHEYQTLQA